MFDYIQLQNNVFVSKDEKESLIRIIPNNNLVLVLWYLTMNTTKQDTIQFTLEDIILKSGYKNIDKHEGKNLDQFRKILDKLSKLNLVKAEIDFMSVKPKDLIICCNNIIYDKGFILLYTSEKDTILNQTLVKDIDNKKLLTYYCYLKTRMYKRPNGDDMVVHGGRAEVCFPSFKTITQDLGITDKVIERYNSVLVELNLIRIGNAGLYYYSNDPNKIVRESCNIYTLHTEQEDYWKTNLKEGIKEYKREGEANGKVFTNKRRYKNNNRKLNGELGSIIKKEKLGTATEKDLIRKSEILESILDGSEYKFKIKALLDKCNGDMTLSDYYGELSDVKHCEWYYSIELSLGLINENGKLLVGYDYYKWIMINYETTKHDYYINCIKAHIKEMHHGKAWGKGD